MENYLEIEHFRICFEILEMTAKNRGKNRINSNSNFNTKDKIIS